MAKNEATLLLRIKQVGREILDKLGSTLSSVASIGAAVGTALVGIGVAAVASFRESEQASNSLNQSMVNQGLYTADLAKKYGEMASKLEGVTTFADEQITSAQSLLQANIGQTEVTEKLVRATLDLAAAKGMDLKSAADLVGKSIGTETNALARQGIELDANASKTQKMASVIDQLNSKYGGQAEAQAKGLGSLEQLKNAADNFLEKVGSRLAPFITFFTRQLTDFSISLEKNKDVIGGLDSVILFVSKSFVFLKNGIVGVAEVMSTGLAAAIETVSLAMSGQFTRAKDMASLGMTEVGNLIKERKNTLNTELAEIDNANAVTEEARRQQELTLLAQSESNKTVVAKTEADKRSAQAKKAADADLQIEKTKNEAMRKDRDAFLSQLATMQSSHNSVMATIGKAAAIAMIWINTAEAASSGSKWGMAMGGPPLAATFSALAYAAGAMQVAQVAGVKLAEGGIVKSRPGGIQATIGEGGQDEAVIPLDKAGGMGFGGGMTINFNGPIMGNESQAMDFARAIDRSLLKLRQSNQSVAFETDVI